jgi:hypothetical protein
MKKSLLLITIFFSLNIFSQKEANFWYFGRNAGIDFNTTPPTALTDSELETFEGCSTISDSTGKLLFYVGAPNTTTPGLTVWDTDHNVINYTNGDPGNNLLGDTSSSQSAMIVPKPGSSNIYYIFTVGDQNIPNFSLYTIDISLNGGKGQLIDENNDGTFFENLANPTGAQNIWTEKVASVRGKECNTFWVVSLAGNTFYSYNVSNTGVNLSPETSTVSGPSQNNTRGYLKLSPDGTKLAVAHENTSEAILYSFNKETGKVSDDGISLFNQTPTTNDGRAYGLEFSIDSKKLYISSSSRFRLNLTDPNQSIYKLFQYDLTNTDILSSKELIYQDNDGFRGALQLGPDGKIYGTIPRSYDDINGDAPFFKYN